MTFPRPLKAEDLYDLPDDGTIHELVEGCLISEPLPMPRHGRAVARITSLLDSHVRARCLGTVYTGDTGFILSRAPDTVRGPDVAFVSRARVEIMVDEDRFFSGAPDLAIEVLSPGNRPGSVREKVADYLTAGARLVWVIDPSKERVTVYDSLLSPRILTSDDELTGGSVLPGFQVKVSELF